MVATLVLPFDENFNSDAFRDELAPLLDVPVNRIRITENFELGGNRFFGVTIIDLTQAQETEVSDFFDDNPTFTLDSFGTVTSFFSGEVAKQNDIVTLEIPFVCTSVSATGFPQLDYIQAFDDALAPVASVTTSINFIIGNTGICDDVIPAGSTNVATNIAVPAADLGAVLNLLPLASSTIDLGGDFGVVSLGDEVTVFIEP